jgi:hypothetical protein
MKSIYYEHYIKIPNIIQLKFDALSSSAVDKPSSQKSSNTSNGKVCHFANYVSPKALQTGKYNVFRL